MPRIYVSSRYRTLNSESTSNFTFPLQSGALEFGEGATATIDSLALSNVFDTVIEGHNRKIYARYYDAAANTRLDKVLLLSVGDKTVTTLATEVQTLLQGANPGTGAWANTTVTCVAVGQKLKFGVTGLVAFSALEILTYDQIRTGKLTEAWTGTGVDALDFSDAQEACAVLGVNQGTLECIGATEKTGQLVDFQAYRTIYIHASGEADSVGPRGEGSIILSVVVGNSTKGDIVTLNESYTAAPVSLPIAVSQMTFSVRDVRGKLLDLQGHDVSFALVTQ